ncbi:MAG: outer membrane lipoprotein carrier protein LolA [Lentimicrobiaceae bacterium]|nr:outer membrane lipoprotein carrier protein LolA [Lentimicrobiaceae bacterium]
MVRCDIYCCWGVFYGKTIKSMRQILLILLTLLTITLSAQNKSVTDVLKIGEIKENIRKSCEEICNIRCDYIQEKSVSLLEDTIKNTGEVIFMKPNNLYWKNNSQGDNYFILKNDSVKIVNNNAVDVMTIEEHLIFREISKIINNGVSDNSIIDEKNFTPSFEENDAYIVVNMKPKKNKMKNVLGNMKIYFDKSSCLVHKIEITDNNHDITTIVLLDIYVNKNIDNTLFNF